MVCGFATRPLISMFHGVLRNARWSASSAYATPVDANSKNEPNPSDTPRDVVWSPVRASSYCLFSRTGNLRSSATTSLSRVPATTPFAGGTRGSWLTPGRTPRQ